MNDLSNTIYEYYVEHFSELPLDKQVHFASRLWLWRRDPVARQLLDTVRADILPTDAAQSLEAIAAGTLIPLHAGTGALNSLRQTYYDRYPQLRMSARLLYWAQLLQACYDVDGRAAAQEVLDGAELAELDQAVANDTMAQAMLSTHAVNFAYLYHRFWLIDEASPAAADWAALASSPDLYDSSDPHQQQLRLYLLTHAIIGETQFYARPIPLAKQAEYEVLIRQLEDRMTDSLAQVNLDNKLEFLVCCRLVKYESRLEAAILTEAEASLSPDGGYLIDTLNANPNQAFTSFDKSEHRSVLYLMATTPLNYIVVRG